MKKGAQAEKETQKAIKEATALQRKADKAQEVADKLQAAADEANDAVLKDPTDQANSRAEKAANAATSAQDTAGRLQKEASAALKKANKLRAAQRAAGRDKVEAPDSRQWVPPTFITVGLLGVLWLVVYYISVAASITVPYLTDLGGWNVIIGMGLMAASFGIATLWK
ncbi:MAG TPA: septation inhibitor protein [Propionibacteriaceae bacterium]|nr:septation inhibitor protein [Propionibacteriaceae bacterium]